MNLFPKLAYCIRRGNIISNSKILCVAYQISSFKTVSTSKHKEIVKKNLEWKANSMKAIKEFKTRINIKNLRRLIRYTIIGYVVFSIYRMKGSVELDPFGLAFDAAVTNSDVKFDDVKGCDEVKKELEDIVYFIKNPSAYEKIGAKLPKGILLYGPPGVGKTLLAKAIAGEAGVPFLSAAGSEFDTLFVGSGTSKVKRLFKQAQKLAPCVIFIDEIDAICKNRIVTSVHAYANDTNNQLLSCMDGFQDFSGVIIIGATNEFDKLDKAALRPGRFGLHINVNLPNYKGRIEIFELYLSKVQRADDIDIKKLASATFGKTGADIRNIVNQAAITCSSEGKKKITMDDLWNAIIKIEMGAIRDRSKNEKQNKITAYHEAGHAVVGHFTKDIPVKIQGVTILPRGVSGGHTSFIPSDDTNIRTKSEILAMIDMMMGGRAAEEMFMGKEFVSVGPSSDLERATQLARAIVLEYTMSDKIGLRVVKDVKCKDCGQLSISPNLAKKTDDEIKIILDESYQRAKALIEMYSSRWIYLAQTLLECETLSYEQLTSILNGNELNDKHK